MQVPTDCTETDARFTDSNSSQESIVSGQITQAVSFSSRSAQFVSEFDVKDPEDMFNCSKCISGSSFLPDSRLLLLDHNAENLKLLDSNLTFNSQKRLSGEPFGLSVYDNEVAVAAGDTIILLCVERDIKEQKTLQIEGSCFGVAHIDQNRLAVTGLNKTKQDVFCIYNSEGNRLSYRDLGQNGWYPHHVTLDMGKTRAFVSTLITNVVTAIDIQTNTIVFTYKHEDLNGPQGMTVDRDNNLYICGEISQNIHQVSPQGDFIRTLLSQSDNLIIPYTISFSPSGDTFIVGGESDIVQVYRMQ